MYPGIQGLSTISATGVVAPDARLAALLKHCHCSGRMGVRSRIELCTSVPVSGARVRAFALLSDDPACIVVRRHQEERNYFGHVDNSYRPGEHLVPVWMLVSLPQPGHW